MSISSFKDFIYRCLHKLDIWVSRVWYKNLAGAKLNHEGRKRWSENQKFYGSSKDGQFPLGYHLFTLPNNQALGTIQQKYREIIKDTNYAFLYDKNNCVINNLEEAKFFVVKNVLRSIPEVMSVLSNDVLDIITAYYQSNYRLTHVAAYRTTAIDLKENPTEVFAHRLHYDRHPVDTLKLFITLSDVTHDNGPLTFFDQSYSQILLKKGYRDRNNYGEATQLIERSPNAIYLMGKTGSAAICSTPKCLHMAGIPKKGKERDLLIFSFESDSKPFDPNCPQTMNTLVKNIDQEYSKYN